MLLIPKSNGANLYALHLKTDGAFSSESQYFQSQCQSLEASVTLVKSVFSILFLSLQNTLSHLASFSSSSQEPSLPLVHVCCPRSPFLQEAIHTLLLASVLTLCKPTCPVTHPFQTYPLATNQGRGVNDFWWINRLPCCQRQKQTSDPVSKGHLFVSLQQHCDFPFSRGLKGLYRFYRTKGDVLRQSLIGDHSVGVAFWSAFKYILIAFKEFTIRFYMTGEFSGWAELEGLFCLSRAI